jgi:hypothetical protein
MLLKQKGKEGQTEPQNQDIHTKTNSLICAAIQRKRQPMLRNTSTPALTPLYCDTIAQFVSKAKQLLRPVNALRREVISNAFL